MQTLWQDLRYGARMINACWASRWWSPFWRAWFSAWSRRCNLQGRISIRSSKREVRAEWATRAGAGFAVSWWWRRSRCRWCWYAAPGCWRRVRGWIGCSLGLDPRDEELALRRECGRSADLRASGVAACDSGAAGMLASSAARDEVWSDGRDPLRIVRGSLPNSQDRKNRIPKPNSWWTASQRDVC